jgi:pleiotropic regulator 1
MRTKNQVFALTGHLSTVAALETQATDPQIISGSADSTIKLWDLKTGKAMSTLTHHKKGIRSLTANPTENSFVSGAADNIKQWQNPFGTFIRNLGGHRTIINALACNQDNVLFSGGKHI